MTDDKIKLEPIKRQLFDNPERANVQDKAIKLVESNPQQFLDAYRKLNSIEFNSFNGRYIGADLFKETFDDYKASKENRNLFNNVLHNSAAVLASAQLNSVLEDKRYPEKNVVVFLTGTPGAGKTTSILDEGKLDPSHRAVYEGQLSNKDTTIPKIKSVLDAGYIPVVLVVHAKPEDALDNTLKRFKETGRGASINTMANIQGNLYEGLAAVNKEFGDKVELRIVDLRDYSKPRTLKGWHNLPILQSEGNYDAIKQKLSVRIEQYKQEGRINEPAYRQAIGKAPDRSYGRVDRENFQQPQKTEVSGVRKQEVNRASAHDTLKVSPYSVGKTNATNAHSAQALNKPTTDKTIKSEVNLTSAKPFVRGR